jgi:hypothetical protein
MGPPLRKLLQAAGMLDAEKEQTPQEPCLSGKRMIWYLQHGEFSPQNPDGLEMAEIDLP